jgi:hypothetical protein
VNISLESSSVKRRRGGLFWAIALASAIVASAIGGSAPAFGQAAGGSVKCATFTGNEPFLCDGTPIEQLSAEQIEAAKADTSFQSSATPLSNPPPGNLWRWEKGTVNLGVCCTTESPNAGRPDEFVVTNPSHPVTQGLDPFFRPPGVEFCYDIPDAGMLSVANYIDFAGAAHPTIFVGKRFSANVVNWPCDWGDNGATDRNIRQWLRNVIKYTSLGGAAPGGLIAYINDSFDLAGFFSTQNVAAEFGMVVERLTIAQVLAGALLAKPYRTIFHGRHYGGPSTQSAVDPHGNYTLVPGALDAAIDKALMTGIGFVTEWQGGSIEWTRLAQRLHYFQMLELGPGPPAKLTLDPKTAANPVDSKHCVTATVTDASGNPVPGITVHFQVTGSVNTSGTVKTDQDGKATFCYTGPALPGSDAIHAFADTDDDGMQDLDEPFDDATKLWVLPVSGGCLGADVTQGSWILDQFGNKATSGAVAHFDETTGAVKGQVTYQVHGGGNPDIRMNVKSINVLALVCVGNRASIFGNATIDREGSFDFRMDLMDGGEPSEMDTLRMRLSNGYDSGEQSLQGGNVQIHGLA